MIIVIITPDDYSVQCGADDGQCQHRRNLILNQIDLTDDDVKKGLTAANTQNLWFISYDQAGDTTDNTCERNPGWQRSQAAWSMMGGMRTEQMVRFSTLKPCNWGTYPLIVGLKTYQIILWEFKKKIVSPYEVAKSPHSSSNQQKSDRFRQRSGKAWSMNQSF